MSKGTPYEPTPDEPEEMIGLELILSHAIRKNTRRPVSKNLNSD